ncbi:hypothetical protein C8A00DRAFT_42499 [Chaetomidium leptoderma]|uniref:NACHT domain-containing protein n=1 Tax=Chaetomidium leptoderma TaxID=669021 RepID=A0AAN6VQW8_9PEZI|nr:hypothetical protein C8A00DRAFT_42499 [Chaetomidium leptoderma]
MPSEALQASRRVAKHVADHLRTFTVLKDEPETQLPLQGGDVHSSTVRDWLEAPDAAIDYDEARKKRYPGTGLWFVEEPDTPSWFVEDMPFQRWLTKPNSFLWLYGFAGCGKSVLCSTAIQHTFQHQGANPRIGVAFFFFTLNDVSKQDLSAMLRALVLQLSGQLNDDHRLLSRLHDSYGSAVPPNQALVDCLRELVREFDHAYILVDALDESPRDKHRKEVLQALVDLRGCKEPGLHLLVTSREEPDIRLVLQKRLLASRNEAFAVKPPNSRGHRHDIESFISGSLKSNYWLRKWGKKDHHKVEEALTNRADGVFRWVECQLDALYSCPQGGLDQLDELLESSPPSLDATYERVLLSIQDSTAEDARAARRILAMLCVARKGLTLPGLIDAMAVELGENPRFNPNARLQDHDIYRICSGFIEIDPDPHPVVDHPRVHIAHDSFRQYLESGRIFDPKIANFNLRKPEAHAEIAYICLTYLLEIVWPGSNDGGNAYPLALYAAKHWHHHYRHGVKHLHPLEDQAIRLFRGTGGEFKQWVQIWNVDSDVDSDNGKSIRDIPSPVYYASLLGLESVVSALLCGKAI